MEDLENLGIPMLNVHYETWEFRKYAKEMINWLFITYVELPISIEFHEQFPRQR